VTFATSTHTKAFHPLQAAQRRPPKPKPCRNCKVPFIKCRPLQRVCGWECGLEVAKKIAEKQARALARADRVKTKKSIEDMEPLSYWEKRAEKEVNRYVRLRDAHLGCISCDKGPNWDGQWHASHFRSVGAASALRFHLWNIKKSCSECNRHKSGNLSEYEPRLRAMPGGNAKVDWLRTQNQIVRYRRDYLERLTAVFRKKANRQAKRNESRFSVA